MWEYNELLLGQKAISLKWVIKFKYLFDRSVVRFKVRQITQDFLQVQGINFLDIFAPNIRRESLKVYLVLCLIPNLFINQVDIIDIYLESLLLDNKFLIFMKLLLEMCNL